MLTNNTIGKIREYQGHIQIKVLGNKKYEYFNLKFKKIIATTNKELDINLMSEEEVKDFIKDYNNR